ncbi:O-GlcNAc transferase [Geomonas limicola]|uniref:O-GlcNAc transferase n=1 Tax=Geomonas limicola TaxID=2740186 RepID=A0A6V8ND50_9BACT|nr:tetratricopeptide repeat protein [Geomonas limicola]GFO70466.1 O-GlcNAc transferase [Geomonas limicola]
MQKTDFPRALGKDTSRLKLVLAPLLLVCLTAAVYAQVAQHRFVSFDDTLYLTANPNLSRGLSAEGIRWAFTSLYGSNWHPVTWLSHLVDVQLFGMAPAGHHLVNVALHIVAVLLLMYFLHRATGAFWRSWLVAALFALHPLHVESVAWAAERKDVLSGLFFFLTLILYRRYAERPGQPGYLLTLTVYLLGLMVKPMLVTLPLLLVLADYWPLKRLDLSGTPRISWTQLKPLVLEKVPFLAAAIASVLVTVVAQQRGGSVMDLQRIPLLLRLENSALSYVRYLLKTAWPSDLAVFYPFADQLPWWQVLGALCFIILTSYLVLRFGRRHPYLPVGWFWYLITLVPVIGLVQVGGQAMADRYSYLPLVGIFLAVSWGLAELTGQYEPARHWFPAAAALGILLLATVSWHQVGYWKDSITLYRHTIEVTRDNSIILDNLGVELLEQGDLAGAIESHLASLRINPQFATAHYNLGFALDTKGDLDGAMQEYRTVLRLNPNHFEALNNLGYDLQQRGDLAGAIASFERASQLRPELPMPRISLGTALVNAGELPRAISVFREVLLMAPDNLKARSNLGVALARQGNLEAASREFETVLQMNPQDPVARQNLERARAQLGK